MEIRPAFGASTGKPPGRPEFCAGPVERGVPLHRRPARIQCDQIALRLTSSHTFLTDESAGEYTRIPDLDI
ncbi:hypothetical protein GCM10010300_49090 [Streptomyces olivaceoviridis]|nr:hypothetical protein GCM10010300_49090 [Streptomyces olivaceoviridis]